METMRVLITVVALTPTMLLGVPIGAARQEHRLQVRMGTAEAEAVLAILDARARGEDVAYGAWDRLLATEGYRRLKEREAAMQRAFTDAEFRAFVLEPQLAERAPALRRTLEAWRGADLDTAAARAFAYLPDGATILATVYPVIKPKPNSFVWDLEDDPAIFLYLNPDLSAAKFENTVAHELHHAGFAGACPPLDTTAPAPVARALEWATAFGEGVAVLAAAGGPAVHPHAASPPEERAVWDRDVANVDRDLPRIEAFLLDVAEGRVTDEAETRELGFELIVAEGVPQGPFYTVGWHVASTIERELGRDRLVATLCRPAAFLAAYNQAAAAVNRRGEGPLPLWSERLIEALTP